MVTDYFDSKTINEDIKNYLHRKMKCYGNLPYAYFLTSKNNFSNPFIISNYPSEWIDKYKENDFHLIDPVIAAAKNRISPFSWDDNVIIKIKSHNARVFELAKAYNIIHGYTFVLHDNNNNLVTLSICSGDSDELVFYDLIDKNKETIQMLLINTHEKVLELKIEINQSSNGKVNNSGGKKNMSQREEQILYWASVGKTYDEIAIILNITRPTVKFHMGNVVKKLNVLNAKHAISLAIEQKLIKPA